MPRTTITSLTLAVALTFAVGPEAFAQDSSAHEPAGAPLIDFRIASYSPGPGRQPMTATKPKTETVYVSDSSIITDKDMTDIRSYPDSDGLSLHVRLTPEGRSRLLKATSSHIDEPIAILVGSRVADAPVVKTPVGTPSLMVKLYLPEAVASDLASKIAAHWPEQ